MMTMIYMILNKYNGNLYIGSTKNVSQRFYQHKRNLRRNTHHCKHLQNAWNYYGEDMFHFTPIAECDESERVNKEQEYVDYFGEFKTLYNSQKEIVNAPVNRGLTGKDNPCFRRDLPSADELAIEYRDNNITIKELANKYNCGYRTMIRRLHASKYFESKNDGRQNIRKDIPSEDMILKEYENSDMTIAELADKYNCGTASINRRLKNARQKNNE